MMSTSGNTSQGKSAIPRALTIAGSDSGGGAGIQADLKTFAALGVYGLSALTAITAQNTMGVRAASPAIIEAVARCISRWNVRLVVDPVMVAKGGDSLLQPEAVTTLSTVLLPLAEVITPNLFEAEVLTGQRIETLDDMCAAAQAIHALGPRHVVVKGGHRAADPVDVYFDGERFTELHAERIQTRHTHGTGCTFSAAIAAFMARGLSVDAAIAGAKHYITEAIRHAPGLGSGHGPVGHFWQWQQT